MLREIEISFSVIGHVTQIVRLSPHCKLSNEQIQEGLENGSLATTVDPNGELIVVANDLESIGEVQYVNNQCMYSDFSVSTNPDEPEE